MIVLRFPDLFTLIANKFCVALLQYIRRDQTQALLINYINILMLCINYINVSVLCINYPVQQTLCFLNAVADFICIFGWNSHKKEDIEKSCIRQWLVLFFPDLFTLSVH